MLLSLEISCLLYNLTGRVFCAAYAPVVGSMSRVHDDVCPVAEHGFVVHGEANPPLVHLVTLFKPDGEGVLAVRVQIWAGASGSFEVVDFDDVCRFPCLGGDVE